MLQLARWWRVDKLTFAQNINCNPFVSFQHMVQAGVGAYPAAPGFPGAGGAQTAGAPPPSAGAGTVAAPTSDGTGLSMVVKNAAAVAAAAAAQAAQDSQLQHQLKQQEANGGAQVRSQDTDGESLRKQVDFDCLFYTYCRHSSVRRCWALSLLRPQSCPCHRINHLHRRFL